MNVFVLLKEIGNSQVVTALVWTLFHSLWQGALFAVMAGIFISSTKRTTPAIRYNVLCVLLLSMLCISMLTFWYAYKSVPARTRIVEMQIMVGSGTHSQYQMVNLASLGWMLKGLITKLTGLIIRYSGLITVIWFALSFWRASRLLFVLGYTRHIRRYRSLEPSNFWIDKTDALRLRLQIRKPVRLLESAVLKIPVVYGYFKPVIFVPLGLFTCLSPKQIEAILLHELAHVRRHDYLVNLFQQAAEIFLFFNPGFLWLSARIREEREHCCDELAIAQTGDRRKYIETLIRFKELSTGGPMIAAMAFTGVNQGLMDRIRRMVYGQNGSLHLAEKWALFICGMAFLFCLPLFKTGLPATASAVHSMQREIYADFPLASVIAEISNDLVADDLASDKKSLSFELTNTWLRINGARQPDRVWGKFFTKYLKSTPYPVRPEYKGNPGFGIFFNAVTHVSGIGTKPPRWNT
jgi:bla regulator protein BlaR1